MQTEFDILLDICSKLTSSGIPYMLTGSMAMSYYAQPRMTRDIDIVVALRSEDTDTLLDLLNPDYYVERDTIAEAIAEHFTFNAIHYASVVKVDFIVLSDTPFAHEEFGRRRQFDVGGFPLAVVSREDLILAKLLWARESQSEMQLRDVRNLLAGSCDLDYIRKWVPLLGLTTLFENALKSDE